MSKGYLCLRQQLKHLSKEEYLILRELSHTAKNLYNEGLYNVRQHYFETKKFLNYQKNYQLLKNSENYKILNSNMAQQILKRVEHDFLSFFALLKTKEVSKVRIPHYLDKDGFTSLIVGFVRLNDDVFVLPYSRTFKKDHHEIQIRIPKCLKDKKIKEIRILPISNARFFEIQYIYETEINELELNQNNALAIDLGINNLCTCVTSDGYSFIMDGKRLKSVNQWYNKENARLQSIKDKQKIKGITNKQSLLLKRRNNIITDIINKTCHQIIDTCITHDIGQIVIGYNKEFQKNCNLGKVNNQNFVNLPIGQLRKKLESKCKTYGITFTLHEESYTSKASFFDNDEIPALNETVNPIFSGQRIKRGLYRNSKGYEYNADVNGALNILKKSKVVCLEALYNRGVVATPIRIRVA